VDITADFGIGGDYVTRLLDRAALFRGYPKEVRTDNGPEFTCRAFMTWAQKHSIKHILIEPGSPTQNAYIESINGDFSRQPGQSTLPMAISNIQAGHPAPKPCSNEKPRCIATAGFQV